MRQEEIVIPDAISPIRGIRFVPDGQGQYPMIIVSHGFFSSYSMMLETAENLAACGYITFCFDFRGLSYTAISGGDRTKATLDTEVSDLQEVLHWAEGLEDVKPGQIYLAGQSMGAVVSLLAARKCQSRIRGMILMCPALNMKESCAVQLADLGAVPEIVENFIGVPGLNLGKAFFEVLAAANLEDFSDITVPVYLIHGTADEMVPVSFSERLAGQLPAVKFTFADGEPHNFKLPPGQAKEAVMYLE